MPVTLSLEIWGLSGLTSWNIPPCREQPILFYSAPEFSDLLNHLNLTADIYSIGMILYRIFNGNHGPFVDEQTSPAAAEKMRLSGAPLPAPLYADYELAEIILKACAFRPEERYDSPAHSSRR